MLVFIERGKSLSREDVIARLIAVQYERNDYEFTRGRVRVRGDSLEVFPAYMERAYRVEFFGDTVERISEIDPMSGEARVELERVAVYPAKHYIVSQDTIDVSLRAILEELSVRLDQLRRENKLLEAQRLEQRTKYDVEMLHEVGYCHGIENYSRHLSARPEGSRPYCLLDYFPQGFLTIIDESHVTLPQLRGMYEGDRARKQVLVEYGFRLPSCLDNRPLKYEEFDALTGQTVYVSATPSDYEIKRSGGQIIEQIIRPTGLVDPKIELRPTEGQVNDLIAEIRTAASRKERVLVTTLTKRMAEDLSGYLQNEGIRVEYIHSEVETIDRTKLLRQLRLRTFDCLVGINLLREGLDLPEVAVVAILDADKEGFLRSATSLIQVSGRAARNLNGRVIMYADTVTGSMRRAIDESNRRRKIQLAYNAEHGITPRSVEKAIQEGIEDLEETEQYVEQLTGQSREAYELSAYVSDLEREMELAARNLQFEKAAVIRDKLREIREGMGRGK
jgi:excinuclease ABC subunit B